MSKIIPAGALMRISTKADNTFEKYLDAARKTHPEMDLAKRLGTTERTLRRWKSGEVSAPLLAVEELQRVLNFEVRHNANSKFKFIDLLALEESGLHLRR
jgi:ribosome-binding protein aMBF1 (putative translation factor)